MCLYIRLLDFILQSPSFAFCSQFLYDWVAPAQLMRPGIGRNASCASGDWLTSRPKGCSQPRELWFFDILMYDCVLVLS